MNQKALQSNSFSKLIREVFNEAFESQRDFLVHSVAQRLGTIRDSKLGQDTEASSGVEWIDIDSLSRLRAVVGGRFQNLKDRWVEAGFPLKEHRGEKHGDVEVDQSGWLELASWVAKQGFEARLTKNHPSALFQIRQVNHSK